MTQAPQNRKSESGNVLFYILIAVALLASLSYAVSQSSRGGTSQISTERVNLIATEILEYSNTLAKAVTQLKLRGCEDTQLSFEHPNLPADFINTGNPTGDNTCHILHIEGAGVNLNRSPDAAFVNNSSENWRLIGSNIIEGMGSTCANPSCADLIVRISNLEEAVCIEINNKLGVGTEGSPPPIDSDMSGTRFAGTYANTRNVADEAGGAAAANLPAACIFENSSEYHFYKVVIAR